MRIRKYPLGAFIVLLLASAYLGLAPATIPTYKQSDKVLHFITFFLLTICFYWILETSRRRGLQLTLFVCPVFLGIGSEVAQGLLPNDRKFDPYDIGANILGSSVALLLCTWYHKRMLERKRKAKGYSAISGEEDVELGESIGEQEIGVTGNITQTLEEEVDNWDENAEDWEEDEPAKADSEESKPQSSSAEDETGDNKKRTD